MELLLSAAFCIAVSLAAYASIESMRRGRALKERLADIETLDEAVSLDEVEMAKPFAERMVFPVLKKLGGALGAATPEKSLKRVSRMLAKAGYAKLDPKVYIGLKLAAALVPAAGLFALAVFGKAASVHALDPILKNFMFCLVLFPSLGYFMPDAWMRTAGSRRRREVGDKLPDLLDLLTVSVEAGLGFEQALMHSAEKMKGAVSDEVKRLLQDMRIGMKHSEAFRALSDRVQLPDLKMFCAALIQADQLGVSIAEVLRVQSDGMRLKRRQRAEEAAMKAPLKLLFPLVLFVFPALFIILLGPAVINIVENMKGAM